MSPFDLLTPRAPDRRGREPDANAWIELHNVIVAAERADDFGPQTVDRIRRQHGVDLRSDLYLERRVNLYQRFLDWHLSDGALTGAERELMAHLADTLHLAPVHLRDAHRRAFGTVVHGALADDCLDVDERLLLYTLQHTLGLDPDLASGAYEVMAREKLLVTVARVLCDGELSPEEAADVERAQDDLGVRLPPNVQEMLGAAAARWHERHASEPAPPPRPAPPPPEAPRTASGVARLVTRAVWREVRLERLEKMLSGSHGEDALSAELSFHYRVPGIALKGVRRHGRVRVYDERIVLAGDAARENVVPMPSVRRVLRFGNGVFLELKSRRAFFLETDHDASLHREVETALSGTPPPPPVERDVWSARWTPLYAAERDHLLRRANNWTYEFQRRPAALKLFDPRRGWREVGDAVVTPDVVTLREPSEQTNVSRESLRAVHRHGRRVWLDRRGGHDWVLELRSEAEAEAFAEALEEE